jgi:hypothetical protein
MTENTAKIYTSTARTISKLASAHGGDVRAALDELKASNNKRYSVFSTSWKNYEKFIAGEQRNEPPVPDEIVLAKMIIEKYNQNAKVKIHISA